MDARKIKKIIVTGHLGFIGSFFCEKFQYVYDIFGFDFAGWGSMKDNLMPGVHDIRVDIADINIVREIIDKIAPDAIVNFAAESHVDRSNESDYTFWQSNVFGARNLALEASRLGIRMVQISTDEVYGDASLLSEPWVETSPISPKNPYAVTKAAAEMLLKVYSKSDRYNLDLIIIRSANTVGPRQFPEKVIPKAIWCFTHNEPFPLFRTPARRMWLNVEDHVLGVNSALCFGKKGGVYNLSPGMDSEETTENIILQVKELIGKGEIERVEDRNNYDLRYWMDSAKAESELGWKATNCLENTLCSTVEWYLNNMCWLEKAHKRIPFY